MGRQHRHEAKGRDRNFERRHRRQPAVNRPWTEVRYDGEAAENHQHHQFGLPACDYDGDPAGDHPEARPLPAEALHALAVSPTRSVVERGLAARMRDGLRAGQPLSTVCANETAWFDRFDVALISAGEQAGDLNETLLAIVNHHLRAGHHFVAGQSK